MFNKKNNIMKSNVPSKVRVLLALSVITILTISQAHAQIDSGKEVFEKAFDEVSGWKDYIDKLLYLTSAIVLSTGVVKIVIKILTKEEGERVELGSEIGRWLLVAAFIAAAGVITGLFVNY